MAHYSDDGEIKQVREKAVIPKEKEKAIDVYTGCIEDIRSYKQLLALYHTHKMADQTDPDYDATTACLKCALMHTICLIGDRLTWVRKGKWGRDQYSSSPLYDLAKNLDDYSIDQIIKLRNLYPHDFLYTSEDRDLQIEFKRLLNISYELDKIQEKMESQIKTHAETLENHSFSGAIATPKPTPREISDCWSIALRQTLLLELFFNNQDKLSTALNKQAVNAAIDSCIKNICQAFLDYRAQMALTDTSKEKSKKLTDTIISIQNEANMHSSEHFQAFAFLENSRLLRNHLAHPNMKQNQKTAQADREKFLKTHQHVKSLFQTCFALAIKKYSAVPFNFILMPTKFENFYSYMRKMKKTVSHKRQKTQHGAPQPRPALEIMKPHNIIMPLSSSLQQPYFIHQGLRTIKPLFIVKKRKPPKTHSLSPRKAAPPKENLENSHPPPSPKSPTKGGSKI